MIDGNSSDFEKVCDFGNLYQAYKDAKSGKGYSVSRAKFQTYALDGVYQLKRRLETKIYQISPYHEFKVYEPKERLIMAGSFKDNIVQHSLCDNVLHPLLRDEFIKTNYAGQLGKGTLYGLNCLSEHMEQAFQEYGYDCWIIKADISKYFYNIDHAILKNIVKYFVKDEDVCWLCEKFIDSVSDNVGVPLGNQLSQVFALLYLSGFDHFVTEELDVKFYGRYMDDIYLIVNDRDYAKHCLQLMKEFIKTLKIEFNEKTQIIPFKNGIKFCGFHTYVTCDGKVIRKLTNEKKRAAKKKYKKKAELVKDGKMTMEKFYRSYDGYKNHISHGNCIKFGYELDKCIDKMFVE